jgi:hypothetical protein
MNAGHQTVRLSPGTHASPDDGMCVMELASVLSGERFSDRPRAVCPVIAAFLRRYNDSVDDARRRDLLPFAAKAVGTRGSHVDRRDRARRCVEWNPEAGGAPRRRLLFASTAAAHADAAARVAAADPRRHRRALRLVEDLVAVGASGALLHALPAGFGSGSRPAA